MKATSRSPESYNGLPMRLDTVDKFVFEGLQARFLDTFNTPTVWTTSSDKVRALDKLFGDNGKREVKYPYAFLTLNSFEVAEDHYNVRHGTLRGTRVSVAEDQKSTVEVRFLPVNISVQTEFITNNYLDLLDFGRRWLFAARRGQLNFQVEYGVTRFDIKVVPDLNVTFPQREGSPEEVQEYVAQTNLIVHGIISEAEPIQQAAVDTAEVTLATQQAGAPSETFWQFPFPKKTV